MAIYNNADLCYCGRWLPKDNVAICCQCNTKFCTQCATNPNNIVWLICPVCNPHPHGDYWALYREPVLEKDNSN